MTDDKGPYFHRCGTAGERSNCKACAYEEGFAAGRASRDGLRAELDRLIYVVYEEDTEIIKELLKDDDKIGVEDAKCPM